MKKSIDEERDLIRRHLLGELSAEEREQFEKHFIISQEYREEVLMAEDDLIQDYLGGHLSEEVRRKFRTHFLSSPQQTQKLQIAEAMDRYFSVEEVAHSPPLTPEPPRRKLILGIPWPSARPALAYALLGVLAIGIVGGSRFAFKSLWENPVERERRERDELRRELAGLNGPAGLTASPSLSLALSPIALRSPGESPTDIPAAGAEVVELLLKLPADEYQNYRAVLRKLDEPDRYATEGLRAITRDGVRAVPLKLPTRLMARGDYRLELSGLSPSGDLESVADYNFRITN